MGNRSDGLVSESIIHYFGLECENHITSVPIESIQHTSHYISGSHSTVHDGICLVYTNVDCLIKSNCHIRPLNLSFSLANVNG